MTSLLASVFSGLAMLFGGMFGHHEPMPPVASSTPSHWTASTTPGNWDGRGGMGSTTPGQMGMMPGIMGQVVSISSTTLTITGKANMSSATTTYSVDASSAKIIKIGAPTMSKTETIAVIKVGDHVLVDGTVTGTNVVAKTILDGVMPPGNHVGHMMPMGGGPKGEMEGPMKPAVAPAQ